MQIMLISYGTKTNQMAQILNATGVSTINHKTMVENIKIKRGNKTKNTLALCEWLT